MNDWGIPEDDDINPLGPARTPEQDAPPVRGDIAEEFTDGTGSVTLCVDAEGVLVDLRVNNNWRESGRGHALALLIMSAALQLQVRRPPVHEQPAMVHPTMPDVDPRRLADADYFDQAEIDRLNAGLRELAQPVDVEAEGYRDRVEFTPAEGESTNRKITVTLGPGRQLQSCSIDPEWSAGARAEKIISTFLEAHDRALAVYTDPVVIPGRGRDRLRQAQDMAQLTLDLLAGRDRKDLQ